MPEEPQDEEFTGEPAYRIKRRWNNMPVLGDLVLTTDGRLFAIVADSAVVAYFPRSAEGKENAEFSLPHPVPLNGDEFSRPVQLCEGSEETLWVAFSEPRICLVQFDIGKSPPEPTGRHIEDPEFRRIGGIAADLDSGYVYVADSEANRIAKYEPESGTRIAILASEGNGDSFVREPHGLFFFSDSLLVADTGKNWLQVIDADKPRAGRGQVLGSEFSPLDLVAPTDVWVDHLGRYYVADTGKSRVLQLTAEGEIRETVTELDAESALEPQSLVANDVWVWVPDRERRRLTIYEINTVGDEP